MSNLSPIEHWEEHMKATSSLSFEDVTFADLFLKYFPHSEDKTCLEIGCAPGRFLTYLGKEFGYNVEGIDYIKGSKKFIEDRLKNL